MGLWNLTSWTNQFPSNSAHLVCNVFYLENFLTFLYSYTTELTASLEVFAKGGAQRGFAKPGLDFIYVDQLNAISHHRGDGDPGRSNHHRAAHNLLGYTPSYTSYIKRTDSSCWIWKKLDWPIRYKLLKKYDIFSNIILKEYAMREARRASGEPSDRELETDGSSRKKKEIRSSFYLI